MGAFPTLAAAQPFVESMSPPVVEKGKTTRVTFHGRHLSNAESVWFSLPDRSIAAKAVESQSDRAIFDLTVSDAAPVGVCGFRVATRDGLGNASLMLVDDLPVRAVAESSDVEKVTVPACVWGTLREASVLRFAITVAAGERLSFEAVANRFGKDADPLLTIRDSSGKIVREIDNDPGLYFDFRTSHVFANAGAYTLELSDARFKGTEHHKFALRIGRFPAGRVAFPIDAKTVVLPEIPDAKYTSTATDDGFVAVRGPQDHGSSWAPLTRPTRVVTVARPFDRGRDEAFAQALTMPWNYAFSISPLRINPFAALNARFATGRLYPTPAVVPGDLYGTIPQPGARAAFLLNLEKNQHIYVRAEAQSLNSPADLEVMLVDRTGRELRRTQETQDEVNFDFTAPAAGEYGLVVRDQEQDGGPAFGFRVAVRSEPFPPRLRAEVEGLTIPQGSYQPVPILVTRTGPAAPIRLKLVGAPAGVTLAPTEIGEKDTAIVCRIEATSAAPLGLHTVRIVAECGTETVPVLTQPLIDTKRVNVDLIPYTLREDQRRLPPSLTDRFAVMITPPSHFTFELTSDALTLPRYQKVAVPIRTTRAAGFDGPIRFGATGGQLADKKEGRTRVYAEFPEATAAQLEIAGVVVSKILSNLAKSRIDVTATGTHQGRSVTLIRTFDLDLTTAFKITNDTPKLTLAPGESAKATIRLDRLPSFQGPVTLQLNPQFGVQFPETITIEKGQSSIDIPITTTPDSEQRRYSIQMTASGTVDGYEEEFRVQAIEVDVKKPDPPKKK